MFGVFKLIIRTFDLSIFKDPKHEQTFLTNGIICLPGLNESEVEVLSDLYKKVKPTQDTGIYSNVQDQSAELNFEIKERIEEVFQPFLKRYFDQVEVAGGAYLVKNASRGSESQLHQDYTVVDEKTTLSFSVWCPLVDVDEQNGCLQVVEGSHLKFDTIRSLDIPSVYLEFDERLEPLLSAFPVKAGTAVVYAHHLFHGSKPNLTDNIRVAAVLSVVPSNAEKSHYLKQEDKVIAVEANDEFWCDHLPQLRSGKMPSDMNIRFSMPLEAAKTLTDIDFFAAYESEAAQKNKPAPDSKPGFLKRLFGLIEKGWKAD